MTKPGQWTHVHPCTWALSMDPDTTPRESLCVLSVPGANAD